jgi:hypothetical protein
LNYRVRVGPSARRTLIWELRCAESRDKSITEAVVPTGAGWTGISGILRVPEQDCAIQKLALKGLRDTNPVEIWLDDVELKRASR